MTNQDRLNVNVPDIHRPYTASADRYAANNSRQVGTSGMFLPPISLGLWWNFGDNIPLDNQRALLRHAFDKGIYHFDLANNYGPPAGSAEKNFGRIFTEDLRPYRDELVISSKAGWDMWPGPYGEYSSRKYILSSAEQSLKRMQLDYVDIFYSHRFDDVTPLEETIGALDTLVRQGKALYVGISSYSPERTAQAHAIAKELGTPLVIHQPSYSMLNRWIEDGLTEELEKDGMGAICFTPLAQGLLTDKYLKDGTAVRARGSIDEKPVDEAGLQTLRDLNTLAQERGQTLAQMALQWTLRNPVVASALIGASRPEQLDENLQATSGPTFTKEELDKIDTLTKPIAANPWAKSTEK